MADSSKILPRFPIILSDRWVVLDDPLQWVLGRRSFRKDGAENQARGESFCTRRHVLLRHIREKCGDVDPNAVAFIAERFPEIKGIGLTTFDSEVAK